MGEKGKKMTLKQKKKARLERKYGDSRNMSKRKKNNTELSLSSGFSEKGTPETPFVVPREEPSYAVALLRPAAAAAPIDEASMIKEDHRQLKNAVSKSEANKDNNAAAKREEC